MSVDGELLARAVIKQALADSGVGAECGQRVSVSAPDQHAARSFLTANSGSWKQAREFWASMADLCPEKLRTGTMELLGIEPPPEAPPAPLQRPANEAPIKLFYPVPKPPKQNRHAKGPKMLALQEMLKRPEGASVDEIIDRFGWAKSTVLSTLTCELRKYGVVGRRGPDGCYRLAPVE